MTFVRASRTGTSPAVTTAQGIASTDQTLPTGTITIILAAVTHLTTGIIITLAEEFIHLITGTIIITTLLTGVAETIIITQTTLTMTGTTLTAILGTMAGIAILTGLIVPRLQRLRPIPVRARR
jgi:hypothetical protein